MQETFEKAFLKINQLKDSEKLEAWLFKLVITTSLDKLRLRNRSNDFLLGTYFIENHRDSNYMIYESNISEILFSDYIFGLKEKDKYILKLKYYYDLSDKDISKTLNIKVGTVKSRLYRAKRLLKSNYLGER